MRSSCLSNPVNNQDFSFYLRNGSHYVKLLEGWTEQHKTWEILFPYTSSFEYITPANMISKLNPNCHVDNTSVLQNL